MRIFLTGHTGFKGSWFSLLLAELGHEVFGFSLAPRPGSIFEKAKVEEKISSSIYGNILDVDSMSNELKRIEPDVVVHFAAQALVSEGWKNPYSTFVTNISGTVNIISTAALKYGIPTMVITTDKVYRDKVSNEPFVESDVLGGNDPYALSKAIADETSLSLASSGLTRGKIVVLRAGNVIGGGDIAANRIIKDVFESYEHKNELKLRNPNHIRPWQHVLDCVSSYYEVIRNLELIESGQAFNVGPNDGQLRTVQELVSTIAHKLPDGLEWSVLGPIDIGLEEEYLALDSTKIRNSIGWQPTLSFEQTLDLTVGWYLAENKEDVTLMQVQQFIGISGLN